MHGHIYIHIQYPPYTYMHTHTQSHSYMYFHTHLTCTSHTYICPHFVHVCDLCCSGRECCTKGLLKSVPGYGTYCFSFVCVWVCVLEVGRGECVCTRAYKVALVSKRAPPTPTLIHTGKVARARSVSQLNYQDVGSFTTTG